MNTQKTAVLTGPRPSVQDRLGGHIQEIDENVPRTEEAAKAVVEPFDSMDMVPDLWFTFPEKWYFEGATTPE